MKFYCWMWLYWEFISNFYVIANDDRNILRGWVMLVLHILLCELLVWFEWWWKGMERVGVVGFTYMWYELLVGLNWLDMYN